MPMRCQQAPDGEVRGDEPDSGELAAAAAALTLLAAGACRASSFATTAQCGTCGTVSHTFCPRVRIAHTSGTCGTDIYQIYSFFRIVTGSDEMCGKMFRRFRSREGMSAFARIFLAGSARGSAPKHADPFRVQYSGQGHDLSPPKTCQHASSPHGSGCLQSAWLRLFRADLWQCPKAGKHRGC